MLSCDRLCCSYGAAAVLQDVSIDVGAGELVGVVGPSGSGKTTLVRALLGLHPPLIGSVWRRPGIRVGYAPAAGDVDWTVPLTVADLLALTGRDAPARAAADRCGLGASLQRRLTTLSAGERQRLLLARALLGGPELLVLDEPTSGLDVASRSALLAIVADVHAAGTTVLLTTHDLNGVGAQLPRIVCCNRTVIADGPPSEVLHPYVLERTFGAALAVYRQGERPVVLDAP